MLLIIAGWLVAMAIFYTVLYTLFKAGGER